MNIIIYHQNKQYKLIQNIENVALNKSSSVYQIENLEDFDFFFINDNEENDAIYLLFNDPQSVLNQIKKDFTVIQAAGGVVQNQQNEILLINRRGFWDLPKGKLDDGETLQQCAIREVTEETGVAPLNNETFLGTTYHTYIQNHQWILKESYWYAQSTTFNEALIPQTEEDIIEAKWVKKEDVKSYLPKTYGNIKLVLNQYLKN